MFFLIGGVQPKTTTLDETRRMCPACGLVQARLKRIDHYLSLFFIPLFPVKKGAPLLTCDRCGAQSPFRNGSEPPAAQRVPDRCPQCGQPISSNFVYCPGCGTRL